MVEEKKAEPKEAKEYTLVQVPTQHELSIQSPDGELMNVLEGIVKILNILTKLK